MTTETWDVVIVGAGFAGASTAAALVEGGVRRVLLLEAEAVPGHHGSGRNAAMARRVIEDPVLARLATESVAGMHALEARLGLQLVDRRGGLLLASQDDADRLLTTARGVDGLSPEVELLSRPEVLRRVPVLAGAPFDAGVLSTGCGVADIHALLTTYLDLARRGGARVAVSEPVTAIHTDAGRVTGLQTPRRRLSCGAVVNAAGFAVNPVAALAGLPALPFDPNRRHLFVTAAWDRVDPAWPFVWNVTDGYYFRPEGRGLLLCACDYTSWGPEEPTTDPAAREQLADKLGGLVPGLDDARPARHWAGLRVLTPDGRFVIGPDPHLEGFFWVAGLGGHGMTTSHAVGRIAAEGLVGTGVPEPYAEAFTPGRFDRLRRASSSTSSSS